VTGEQGTRAEKRRGDGTRRDKTRQDNERRNKRVQEKRRQEVTGQEGAREEERSCYTIPHTDKRSFRIHGSRGHFTRRQLTPRALNARVHSSPRKKGCPVRVWELSAVRDPDRPWGRPRAGQGPLGPAQEHPRATQDNPGRPKTRPRDAKTAPGAAKRAPGAPGRLPGAPPSNLQKLVKTCGFYKVS